MSSLIQKYAKWKVCLFCSLHLTWQYIFSKCKKKEKKKKGNNATLRYLIIQPVLVINEDIFIFYIKISELRNNIFTYLFMYSMNLLLKLWLHLLWWVLVLVQWKYIFAKLCHVAVCMCTATILLLLSIVSASTFCVFNFVLYVNCNFQVDKTRKMGASTPANSVI